MIKVLLQTTIESIEDDWNIERFSLLKQHLESARDASGAKVFDVTARNRALRGSPDPIISTLAESDFDEVWLIAVDVGDGLAPEDCAGLSAFRRRGGGLMVTRDHMDLGSSVCTLGGVGAAHHFHSKNVHEDPTLQHPDNTTNTSISWPNYYSGENGDYQRIAVVGAPHEVLYDPTESDQTLKYLPAHPHEGLVSAPRHDHTARVIMQGRSIATTRRFNLAVAFEATEHGGRAIAQSTFHHFADFNWDIEHGSPSFVTDRTGDNMRKFDDALRSTKQYAINVALWLAGRNPRDFSPA
ncbi:hypothetical protein [Roseateles noduli]|uniref:hypothetical protein n=1 Tax=Roseateles noduli TaxID=2052484 RepID=UPI003D651072